MTVEGRVASRSPGRVRPLSAGRAEQERARPRLGPPASQLGRPDAFRRLRRRADDVAATRAQVGRPIHDIWTSGFACRPRTRSGRLCAHASGPKRRKWKCIRGPTKARLSNSRERGQFQRPLEFFFWQQVLRDERKGVEVEVEVCAVGKNDVESTDKARSRTVVVAAAAANARGRGRGRRC